MKIYPHLWFKSQAEEAMEFYTSIFKDSKRLGITNLPHPSFRSCVSSWQVYRSSL